MDLSPHPEQQRLADPPPSHGEILAALNFSMDRDREFTVSVAMCTYNGAAFLSEQLESIGAQSRLPDEVVVCDDGSTDETGAILGRWAREAIFTVRRFQNETRLGVAGNFSRVISLCRGDIVVLADQDDVWYPDKIASLLERFEGDDELDAVFSDADLVDEYSRPLGRRLWEAARFSADARRTFRDEDPLDVLLHHNVVTGATMAFRIRWVGLLLPIPAASVHDEWIALVLALVGKLDLIEEPLIAYRQHRGNVIGTMPGDLRSQVQVAVDTGPIEYTRLLEILVEARDRIHRSNVAMPAGLAQLECRIAHTKVRLAIAASRRPTLLPVLREVWSGRYSRFSEGWKSALKDIVGSWTVYRRRD